MNRNPAANCGNCPYWYWPAENDYGECRVNAPKAYTFNSGEVEFHLHTHNDHWCGQHPDFWTHTPKKIVIGPEIVNCDYVPTKCESCNRQLSVTTDKDSPCYTCGHDFKNYKPFDDPGVLAMQALAETDRKEADT